MELATPEQQLETFNSARTERREQVEQQPVEQRESEYETTSRATEEAIKQEAPSFEATSHAPRSVEDSLPPEEQAKIQEWINIAANDGPYAAIQKAKDADPALLDAFHAALTGQLHDQLTQLGKLEEVR